MLRKIILIEILRSLLIAFCIFVLMLLSIGAYSLLNSCYGQKAYMLPNDVTQGYTFRKLPDPYVVIKYDSVVVTTQSTADKKTYTYHCRVTNGGSVCWFCDRTFYDWAAISVYKFSTCKKHYKRYGRK